MALVTLVGGFLVIRGSLTLGSLLAILSYVSTTIQPIQELMSAHTRNQLYRASLCRATPFLRTEPVRRRAQPGSVEGLVVEDLCFKYKGDRGFEISHFYYTFHSGKIYILTGSNGCGKTTLIKLLTGLLKPEQGVVRTFPTDVDFTDEEAYNAVFAVLPSRSLLFEGSVLENVSLGMETVVTGIRKTGQAIFPELTNLMGSTSLSRVLSTGQSRKVELLRTLVRDAGSSS